MFQSIAGNSNSRENDPLLSAQSKDRSKVDDSKDSFCKRRGVSIIFSFAFISLLCVIFIVFKSQIVSLFGYKNINHSSQSLLFEKYESSWQTLESVPTKHIPKDWEYHSSCDETHYFDMTFAVSIQNTDKLTDELLKTSLPESETYGQHWTPEQVRSFFTPKEESIEEVYSWLEYHGIAREEVTFVSKSRSYMRVNVNCEQANRMLNTEFGFWTNVGEPALAGRVKTNSQHLRVKDGYSVPESVKEHLDFISPTLRFPMRHHTSSVELTGFGDVATWNEEQISAEVRSSYVTPNKLTYMYHLEDYLDTASSDDNSQAIASFIEEWFSYADYYLFQTFFEVTRTRLTTNPDSEPTDGEGDEAELDVQYVTSTGRGIKTIAYDVEDDLYFITLAERIADSDSPPFVVSISYGGDEQSNGWGYCNRASIDLGIVSLLGVTWFVSSGDDGAAGSDGCDTYEEFAPSFPATSPYVMAVGGTEGGIVTDDVSESTAETAWSDSGGGFSTFFDRMSHQDDAVTTYFEDNADELPTSSYYNEDGRAYPDIAALSKNYIVAIDRLLYSVSGTSCSSPSVAGMFSQINDIRLQNGLSVLGWVNPRIYALFYKGQSEYFNDVVSGYNVGCEVDDDVGFYAAKGWDPVTGVGTPKFSKIAEALIYK